MNWELHNLPFDEHLLGVLEGQVINVLSACTSLGDYLFTTVADFGPVGIREEGLRLMQVFIITSVVSKSIVWHLASHSSVNYKYSSVSRIALTWQGIRTSSLFPKVNFVASPVSKAITATAVGRSGYPAATHCNFFKNYATGQGSCPSLWVKTTKAIPLFSNTERKKSFLKSGIPSAAGWVKSCFVSLRALPVTFVHLGA